MPIFAFKLCIDELPINYNILGVTEEGVDWLHLFWLFSRWFIEKGSSSLAYPGRPLFYEPSAE